MLRRPVESAQYCSREFQALLKGLRHALLDEPQGQLLEHSPTESLWGALRQARICRRFATRREAMDEVLDWLIFYNLGRLHLTLNYVNPMEFERSWYAAQRQQAA